MSEQPDLQVLERVRDGAADRLRGIGPEHYGSTGYETSVTYVQCVQNLVTMLHIRSENGVISVAIRDFEAKAPEDDDTPATRLEALGEVGTIHSLTFSEDAVVYSLDEQDTERLADLLEDKSLEKFTLGEDIADIPWYEYHTARSLLKICIILGKGRTGSDETYTESEERRLRIAELQAQLAKANASVAEAEAKRKQLEAKSQPATKKHRFRFWK